MIVEEYVVPSEQVTLTRSEGEDLDPDSGIVVIEATFLLGRMRA